MKSRVVSSKVMVRSQQSAREGTEIVTGDAVTEDGHCQGMAHVLGLFSREEEHSGAMSLHWDAANRHTQLQGPA